MNARKNDVPGEGQTPFPTKLSSFLFTLLTICLGCGVLPADDPQSGDKIQLKLKLTKGDYRYFYYALDARSNVHVGEQTTSTQMNLHVQLGISTIDVDGSGNHTLKIQYDRVKFAIHGGGIKIDYDSKINKPDNPTTKAFSAMVGTALTFKLAPTGEIIKVDGYDQIARKLGKAFPGGEERLKEQFESSKNQIGQIVAVFATKPVGIGDSWNAKLNATGPQTKMNIDTTFTLAERKNGKAVISIDGEISGMESELSGTMNGSTRVDEGSGWTESGNIVMSIKGKVQGVTMDMDAQLSFGNGKLKESSGIK